MKTALSALAAAACLTAFVFLSATDSLSPKALATSGDAITISDSLDPSVEDGTTNQQPQLSRDWLLDSPPPELLSTSLKVTPPLGCELACAYEAAGRFPNAFYIYLSPGSPCPIKFPRPTLRGQMGDVSVGQTPCNTPFIRKSRRERLAAGAAPREKVILTSGAASIIDWECQKLRVVRNALPDAQTPTPYFYDNIDEACYMSVVAGVATPSGLKRLSNSFKEKFTLRSFRDLVLSGVHLAFQLDAVGIYQGDYQPANVKVNRPQVGNFSLTLIDFGDSRVMADCVPGVTPMFGRPCPSNIRAMSIALVRLILYDHGTTLFKNWHYVNVLQGGVKDSVCTSTSIARVLEDLVRNKEGIASSEDEARRRLETATEICTSDVE